MRNLPKPKRCPVCRKPESTDHAPFCSAGCKDRDLLKWLGDGYRIPGPPADEHDPLGRVDTDSDEG
ncbi:MAG: DNA gyrase inhibitor YacG [Sphingomicrobium sp.]